MHCSGDTDFLYIYGVNRYLGLGKLRVRLGVGEEGIVRFVLVDQVLAEEFSSPGFGVNPDDDDLPFDGENHRGDGHHQEEEEDADDDVGVPWLAILAEIFQF